MKPLRAGGRREGKSGKKMKRKQKGIKCE